MSPAGETVDRLAAVLGAFRDAADSAVAVTPNGPQGPVLTVGDLRLVADVLGTVAGEVSALARITRSLDFEGQLS